MPINLLQLIQSQLGSTVVGQLSGLLGESESATRGSLSAAVPALLGGLVKQGSTRSGATSLYSTLAEIDTSGLDDIVGNLGSGGFQQMRQQGSGLLEGLFGGGLARVTDILTGSSGLSRGGTSSLLSVLAPIVMGFVGRQVSRGGLDVGGLTDLLAGQREHLRGALPGGLDEVLGLDEGDSIRRATERATMRVRPERSALRRFLPLAIGLVVAWLAYQLFTGTDRSRELPDVAALPPSEVVSGLDATFDELSGTIEQVRDVSTAREVVPELETAGREIGAVAEGMSTLSGPLRAQLADRARNFAPRLSELMNNANAIPGVGEVLAPALQKIALGLETLGAG